MPHPRRRGRNDFRMATPARPVRDLSGQPRITYANERAKRAWRLRQAVSEAAATLPSEDQNLRAAAITFDAEHMAEGTYAILFAGTVIGTDRAGVFLIPERTRTILKRLRIPYRSA